MDEPFYTAKCNCLFANSNANLTGIGAAAASGVKRHGNWVGGTAYCFADRIVFKTNALNATFQHDSSDLVVPIDAVNSVKLGRMMRLFKTVDVDSDVGSLRFRCLGKGNDRLADAIRERLA